MQHLSADKLLCNKPMKPIDLDEGTINKEVPDSLSAKRNSSTRFNCLPCWSFVTILSSASSSLRPFPGTNETHLYVFLKFKGMEAHQRRGRRDVQGDFSSDRGNPPLFN
jgi:hypothetical protein